MPNKYQRFIRAIDRNQAQVECLNCSTLHTADRDEDGGAEIEQEKCHHEECTAMLCSECPQFSCADCGLRHCAEHVTEAKGDKLCPLCVAGRIADAMEEEPEPPCTCIRTDVDQYDASDCEQCNWRRRITISTTPVYYDTEAQVEDQRPVECPF